MAVFALLKRVGAVSTQVIADDAASDALVPISMEKIVLSASVISIADEVETTKQ